MTVLNSRRVGLVLGLCGTLVQLGCSDDDSPTYGPDLSGDSGASSASDGGSNEQLSRSDDSDAGAADASSDGSETTSGGESSTTADAATDAGVTDGGADADVDVGLLEGLSADPDTTIFAQLIVRAEMQEDLEKEGPFTVLAPTNGGFERLPEGYLDSLSRKQVEALVRNHLVSEAQSSAELVSSGTVFSVLDLRHEISLTEGEIYIDGLTRVTARDRALRADTVHKVDSVLTVEVFPGTLAEAVHAYPRLSELESHLTDDQLALLGQDDKTLFAPINGGFEGYAESVEPDAGDAGETAPGLSYHVLPHKVTSGALARGGVVQTAPGHYMGVSTSSGLLIHDGQRVSRVVIADLPVESGDEGSVLHVVQSVLEAPPNVAEVLARSAGGETFTSLRASLSSTTIPSTTESFSEHLATAEAVTLFAPSDAAFNRITGTFGNDLAKVLGFHVVDAVIDSPALSEPGQDGLPNTITNSSVKAFTVVSVPGPSDPALLVDGLASIVVRDIPAANGVVHALDGVLVPQDVTFPGTTAQALASYPALSKVSDAVTQTGLLTGLSTLFAPYDLAIGEVASANAFVEAHAISPGVRDRLMFGTQVFTSLGGGPIDIDPETLDVNGVHIVRPDLLTQSGVVHVIDGEFTAPEVDAGN